MWDKGVQYLKKMGNVILAASVIIWALGYFPKQHPASQNAPVGIAGTAVTTAPATDIPPSSPLESSYIGRLGKAIQPFFNPLGFDWKMSVGILTGVAAKEVVVATMGVLYATGNDQGSSEIQLSERLKNEKFTEGKKQGQPVIDKISALSFVFFILLYFPCIATITAIGKESGSWKWALLAIAYTTALAWIVAFAIYNVGNLIF